MKVLMSKSNQIGDMVLALPLVSLLKRHHPDWSVWCLGKPFTEAVVAAYADVDGFVDYTALMALPAADQVASLREHQFDAILHVTPNQQLATLAKRAKIKWRIGTRNRWYHWLTCNRLISLSRKASPLHEAQLDCHFLRAFDLPHTYSLTELAASYRYKAVSLTPAAATWIDPTRFNLVIHPLTRGRHIEWTLPNYRALLARLPAEQVNVVVTGHGDDVAILTRELQSFAAEFPAVRFSQGQLTVADLVSVIHHADGLIASSTGPVHLAASAGIRTLGLYAPIKPFDAARWGPVGRHASTLAAPNPCSDCRDLSPCRCAATLAVEAVYQRVNQWVTEVNG